MTLQRADRLPCRQVPDLDIAWSVCLVAGRGQMLAIWVDRQPSHKPGMRAQGEPSLSGRRLYHLNFAGRLGLLPVSTAGGDQGTVRAVRDNQGRPGELGDRAGALTR